MSEEAFAGIHSQQPMFTAKNYANSLWMGDIEAFMDEKFIREAFALTGELVNNVKIIKNKVDGSPVGYGFVSFSDSETAKRVLCQLNRKQIPNAPQGKRFKLNTVGRNESQKMYTIFVGDLPEELDDITLFTGFSVRYPSTKTAKVILNNDGRSKCFGFVKFGDENEYESALRECPHTVTFGSKPIRVSVAIPKNKNSQRQTQAIGTSNIVLTQSNEAMCEYNNNFGENCGEIPAQLQQQQQYDSGYQYYDYNAYYHINNFAGSYYTVQDSNSFGASNTNSDQCGIDKPYSANYEESTNSNISSFEV